MQDLSTWDWLYTVLVIAPREVNLGLRTPAQFKDLTQSLTAMVLGAVNVVIVAFPELPEAAKTEWLNFAETEFEKALEPADWQALCEKHPNRGQLVFEVLADAVKTTFACHETIQPDMAWIYARHLFMCAFALVWLNPFLRAMVVLSHNAWQDSTARRGFAQHPPVYKFQTSVESLNMTKLCLKFVLNGGTADAASKTIEELGAQVDKFHREQMRHTDYLETQTYHHVGDM